MGDSEQNDESWRGQVGRLTAAEMEEFLAGNILCRLAVLDPDGWPYIIPVWFQYKDGGYYIIPRERSIWAKYMARDPRVSLVIDETGRQRKVMVRGEAECSEEHP